MIANAAKPIRLGLAGIGFGASVQLPVLQSLPGVSVVAITSEHIEKARVVAAEFNIPKVCSSVEEMIASKDIDAFIFALPPRAGVMACERALATGKPVLSEKPLAWSLAAAQELEKLAQGKITMVDFEFAEIPAFQKLKEIISAQTLGQIRAINIIWRHFSYAQKKRQWSWKTDKNEGGGVNMLLGSHVLYLLEWLVGHSSWELSAKLSSVFAQSFAPQGKVPADDTTAIILKGKVPLVNIFLGNALPGENDHRWEIFCDGGIVILENATSDHITGFSIRLHKENGSSELVYQDAVHSDVDGRQAAFSVIAERFIEGIRSGKPVAPDFAVGCRVQELLEAVFRSNQEEKSIHIS